MKLNIDFTKFLMMFFVSHLRAYFFVFYESESTSYLKTFFILNLVNGSFYIAFFGDDESSWFSDANLKSYSYSMFCLCTILALFWIELWPESEDCFSFLSSSFSLNWIWIKFWVNKNCSLMAAIR